MAEPEDILEAVINHFGPRPLHGKKVLVSAGPTREAIDPVRFISNGSTGTMGYALARQAANLGATVTLVSGPVALSPDGPWELINVNSAAEMFVAMTSRSADQDLIIMTAAVGDYQPVEFSPTKIKKADKNLVLELGRTQDILRHLGDTKPAGQVLVGFALETNDEEAHALDKMKRKNLDFIVLNSLRDSGAGFGGSTNKVTVFGRDGQKQSFELKGKVEVAADILNAVCKTIQQ